MESDNGTEIVADITIQRILGGSQQVVSHAGASQYAPGGVGASACGIASLNCVRVVFEKENDGLRDEALLKDVICRHTTEEITSICAQWSSKFHLEVDEIRQVPVFERSLKLVSQRYARSSFKTFQKILLELRSTPATNVSAAVVITRPPEILTCLKIATATKPVYVIFDSHPRPLHPNGAGFIFNTSIDATATYLNNLLAVDARLLADSNMQWETQLLANFSGHIFVSNGSENNVADLKRAILDASVTILDLRAQAAELISQNDSLAKENKRLEDEIEETEIIHLTEMKDLQSIIDPTPSRPSEHSYSGPSGSGALRQDRNGVVSSSIRSVADFKDDGFRRNADRYPSGSNNKGKEPVRTKGDGFGLAMHIPADWNSGAQLAAWQQREFDQEDRRLRQERDTLAKFAQVLFECCICIEKQPEDYVVRIDCNHKFCRDCIRQYIVSKLKEHRFPIPCPVCMGEKIAHEPGMINTALIEQVGISDKDYRIFEELQLAAFSILLHCPTCQRSAFVDRDEYQEQKILVCPLPGCNHSWCKACQQKIDFSGPQHSCDGSSELTHLMKQKGWKHCPGCQTPIQKESGCNHMTCMSPGCNAHFCYICGEMIVQSSLREQIQRATSAHYRKCRLFEG